MLQLDLYSWKSRIWNGHVTRRHAIWLHYATGNVVNPFLFIRGLSCPRSVLASFTQNCLKLTFPGFPYDLLPVSCVDIGFIRKQRSNRVHIYRSTGQRSMFQTSMFCRSTALYINKKWLKYRTKCHRKMLCRSTALYINCCWSKNHFSFILFHRSIIICLLAFSSKNTPQRSLFKMISLLILVYIKIIYQLLKVIFTLSSIIWC